MPLAIIMIENPISTTMFTKSSKGRICFGAIGEGARTSKILRTKLGGRHGNAICESALRFRRKCAPGNTRRRKTTEIGDRVGGDINWGRGGGAFVFLFTDSPVCAPRAHIGESLTLSLSVALSRCDSLTVVKLRSVGRSRSVFAVQ